MKCSSAYAHMQRLDEVFKQIKLLPAEPEIHSHWAKYLCVLVSGFIETSVSAIFIEYSKKKAVPHLVNYIQGQLLGLQNMKMPKIFALARSFNPIWADELEAILTEEHKDAVNSIVDNRNKIAHGEYSGVTFAN